MGSARHWEGEAPAVSGDTSVISDLTDADNIGPSHSYTNELNLPGDIGNFYQFGGATQAI